MHKSICPSIDSKKIAPQNSSLVSVWSIFWPVERIFKVGGDCLESTSFRDSFNQSKNTLDRCQWWILGVLFYWNLLIDINTFMHTPTANSLKFLQFGNYLWTVFGRIYISTRACQKRYRTVFIPSALQLSVHTISFTFSPSTENHL